MNIEQLSKQLMMEEGLLLIKITELNREYSLGVEDFSNINKIQCRIIRASLDTRYLIQLLGGTVTDSKYNYQNHEGFFDLQQWVANTELTGFSTKAIIELLPELVQCRGSQAIAAVMRGEGYVSKVVRVGDGKKQGRRWYKESPSFL